MTPGIYRKIPETAPEATKIAPEATKTANDAPGMTPGSKISKNGTKMMPNWTKMVTNLNRNETKKKEFSKKIGQQRKAHKITESIAYLAAHPKLGQVLRTVSLCFQFMS